MKTSESSLPVDSINSNLRRHAVSSWIVGISIILYGFACMLPTIQYETLYWAESRWTIHQDSGYLLLLYGFAGIFLGQFAWYANPLLWIAWIAVLKRRWNLVLLAASAAFLVGLNTFSLKELPIVFIEEPANVTGFGVGVYVWLAAMLVVVTGALIGKMANASFRQNQPSARLREMQLRYLLLGASAVLAFAALALLWIAALDSVMALQVAVPAFDFTPPAGRIVFLVGETNPYVINADGTGLQKYQEQDTVSPDGKHVARVEGPVWEWTLCIENSEGGGKTCFENAGHPVWSPDGNRLVFTQYDKSINSTSIACVKSDGTGLTLLGEGAFARWSPDGQFIFYTGVCSVEHPAGGVCAIKPDGTSGRWIAAGYSTSIDWSPDYRRMVFSDAYSEEIYIADADGTNVSFIAEGQNPDWSPDGTKIAFENQAGNTYETNAIYIMNPDGTGLTRLTKGRRDGNPVWSPDGKHIAFESYLDGDDYHIFIMHPDGSNVHRLTNLSARETNPSWLE